MTVVCTEINLGRKGFIVSSVSVIVRHCSASWVVTCKVTECSETVSALTFLSKAPRSPQSIAFWQVPRLRFPVVI